MVGHRPPLLMASVRLMFSLTRRFSLSSVLELRFERRNNSKSPARETVDQLTRGQTCSEQRRRHAGQAGRERLGVGPSLNVRMADAPGPLQKGVEIRLKVCRQTSVV